MTKTKQAARLAIALMLAGVAGCDGHGGRSEAQGTCSLETLKGLYIYAYDGFIVSGASASQRLPFASAGHETYSGDGEVVGFSTTSTNGEASGSAYAGTYTVEPDCTGTTTLTNEEDGSVTHYDIVIEQNGLEVGYVQTDPNAVSAGFESRRSGAQKSCNLATLQGSYVYANDGFETGGGTSSERSPFAQAGRDVYNGDGTMSGMVTVSVNGVVRRTSYDGTYTINSDCSGTITSAGDDQQALHFAIYVDPSGDQLAFVDVDANVVNASYDSRQ